VTAAAVRPIITRLTDRGLPMPAAMLLTYLTGLLAAGLFIYLFGGPLMAEIQRLTNRSAFAYESTRLRWVGGTDFQQALAARLPPPEEVYEQMADSEGNLLALGFIDLTRTLVSLLGGLAMVLVLSIYWSADQAHFERLWLALLPATGRARARDMWRRIESGVGAYMRSEAIQAVLGFLFLLIGYAVLGLDYPILLALIGAIAWIIPIVGVIFALGLVLLATVPADLETALLAGGYTLTVLLLLELAVEPRFFNRRRYSSILIVLAMIPLADTFGVVGLILAPPLAAAIQIFLSTLLKK
jgi:predicted PurR-regulated permease PerM